MVAVATAVGGMLPLRPSNRRDLRTVFHRIRSPLWKRFRAICQLAQGRKGVAVLKTAKQIGAYHSTGWLMVYEIRRRALRCNDQTSLLHQLVEAAAKVPWIHKFIDNLKCLILETYHHSSPQDLGNDLAESAYLADHDRHKPDLLDDPIEISLAHECMTYRKLVTGAH